MGDGGADVVGDAATAQHVDPSGGLKDGLAQAQPQHPWHTAPWHAAKSALGTKGAIAAIGGAVAVLGLAIGAVIVLSGGDGTSSDSALETDGPGGDKDRIPGGGDKEGETDGSSSSSTDATTSSTTTTPGSTSTTDGEGTPAGVPATTPDGSTVPATTPSGDTVPVTSPPATTATTLPPGTTTTPTRPVIKSFTAALSPNFACPPGSATVGVTFRWASNGVMAKLVPKSGTEITGLKGTGQKTACSPRAHTWTLIVTASNGTSASRTISSAPAL
jgi:hypothetical protein